MTVARVPDVTLAARRARAAFGADLQRMLGDAAQVVATIDAVRVGGEVLELTTRWVSVARHPLTTVPRSEQLEQLLAVARKLDPRSTQATIALAVDRGEFMELHTVSPLARTPIEVLRSYEQRIAKLQRWHNPLIIDAEVDVKGALHHGVEAFVERVGTNDFDVKVPVAVARHLINGAQNALVQEVARRMTVRHATMLRRLVHGRVDLTPVPHSDVLLRSVCVARDQARERQVPFDLIAAVRRSELTAAAGAYEDRHRHTRVVVSPHESMRDALGRSADALTATALQLRQTAATSATPGMFKTIARRVDKIAGLAESLRGRNVTSAPPKLEHTVRAMRSLNERMYQPNGSGDIVSILRWTAGRVDSRNASTSRTLLPRRQRATFRIGEHTTPWMFAIANVIENSSRPLRSRLKEPLRDDIDGRALQTAMNLARIAAAMQELASHLSELAHRCQAIAAVDAPTPDTTLGRRQRTAQIAGAITVDIAQPAPQREAAS